MITSKKVMAAAVAAALGVPVLAMAQATRRAGGIVIVQVKRMARRNTLPAKDVKIPGILVDFIVVDLGVPVFFTVRERLVDSLRV